MKTLIYTFSEDYTTELAINMIPKGFEPLELHSEKEVLAYLESGEDVGLLITEAVAESFLKQIRKINNDIHLYLIFHSSLKPTDLMKLSSLDVNALIPYNEEAHMIAEEVMKNAMSTSIINNEKRFHVRIQPTKYENIEASIYIKGINRFVHGSLIDVSAGGAAVRLNDSIEASILDLDKTYNPLVLHITGSRVKTLARLKGKRDDIAGFQFENIEKQDMHSIASYIHTHIQENSKKVMKDLLKDS